MAQYGIQWDSNALSGVGQIQWIECKSPNKYLLKQNNQFYTIKPDQYRNNQFQSLPITTPTSQDYTNFGFDNINLLTQNTTIGTETFIPKDKLKLIGNGKFDVTTKEII